jgi:outer membrane protein
MKNINTILNVVLLAAVAILFFLHFKSNKSSSPVSKRDADTSVKCSAKIAYFNMDSLEKQYTLIVDRKNELKGKEQSLSNKLNELRQKYQARAQQLQSKQSTMTQAEGEAAQQEYSTMQTTLQQEQAGMSQTLQEENFKMIQEINKNIEEYLKTYNQDKKYAFIFSHTQGDNMFYKDTLYNITSEVIEGLNAGYKKK